MKYTKGPWQIFRTPSGYDHIRGPNNERISHEVSTLDESDETMGNAQLIACAPEMLDALETVAHELTNGFRLNERVDIPSLKKVVFQILKKVKGDYL